jgi:hypothetical protein
MTRVSSLAMPLPLAERAASGSAQGVGMEPALNDAEAWSLSTERPVS